MKILAICLLLLALLPGAAAAQLSGTYTIGGDLPDFVSFDEAAQALLQQGISGPVTFEVRPGLYQGSDAPVLDLSANVAGVSDANRIVFQPASGATIDDVVLEGLAVGANVPVVHISSDYVTLRNLTIRGADTVEGGDLVSLTLDPVADPDIDGVVIEGCFIDGAGAFRAIIVSVVNNDTVVRHNQIAGITQAIYIHNAQRPLVEGNHVSKTSTVPGYAASAIEIGNSSDAVVRNNMLDYAGARGAIGISLANVVRFHVEGNQISNVHAGGEYNAFTGISVNNSSIGPTTGAIVNNMVSVNTPRRKGILIYGSGAGSDDFLIAHNTVYFPARGIDLYGGSMAFQMSSGTPNLEVVNNIFVDRSTGSNWALLLSNTEGSTYDHNVLFSATNRLAQVGSAVYANLDAWQAAGFGEHSRSFPPDVVNFYNDLHLSECAFSDPDLRSALFADVPLDFDKETRDVLAPFMGADEPLGGPPAVFEGPTLYAAGKGPYTFTSADLDGDGDRDIVVNNPGSFGDGNGDNDVTVLLNDGAGAFAEPVHLEFGNDPNFVQVGQLNADTVPDLVAATDEGVLVRFGAGAGAYTAPVTLPSTSRVTDLELADYDLDGDTDVLVLTEVSQGSIIRTSINEGDGTFEWTNADVLSEGPYFISDFEVADLNGDHFPDLLAIEATGRMITLHSRGIVDNGVSAGFDEPVFHDLLVRSAPSQSRFVVADFDGDLDLDLLMGSSVGADSLVLALNDGTGGFSERMAFPAHLRGASEVAKALDYDGDGDLDLVSASLGTTLNGGTRMDLHLNNGVGGFERIALCRSGEVSGYAIGLETGVLDGDASPDVAVLTYDGATYRAQVEVLKNLGWRSSQTALEPGEGSALPERPKLNQNYPNPFNPSTTISYALPRSGPVRLVVYDVLGRTVQVLVDEEQGTGQHAVVFEARGLSSGLYFYRLEAGSSVEARRMILLK